MKEFIKTERNGILRIDRILFESFYPVLFSCKNEKEDTFICVCCQNNANGIKWLIGKTDISYIIKMLKDEITIRELLLNGTSVKMCVDYQNEQYRVKYIDEWDKDSIYLPKEDSYINADPGEFDEDIAYYLEQKKMSYKSNVYDNIIKKTEIINKEAICIDEVFSTELRFLNSGCTSEIFETEVFKYEICMEELPYMIYHDHAKGFQSSYQDFGEKFRKEVSNEELNKAVRESLIIAV